MINLINILYYIILQLGHFQTRSGDTVRLSELLDEGIKRSEAKLLDKGRDKVPAVQLYAILDKNHLLFVIFIKIHQLLIYDNVI